MSNRDGAHRLAQWIRQPETLATIVALIGLNLLIASLYVPIGITNIAMSALGACCLVAGLLTLLVHLLGRGLGVHGRSQKSISEGRAKILFPGVRPPQMHVRSHQPAPAAAAAAAEPPAGDEAVVVDLTDSRRTAAGSTQDTTPTVPTPAVPEQAHEHHPHTAVG